MKELEKPDTKWYNNILYENKCYKLDRKGDMDDR